MSFTVSTDLWDLCQRVGVLENTSDKHNMRLNKLENTRDDKVMPEGVDFSHNHTVCEDYNKVRFAIIEKQKVLEMVMDQRDRYSEANYDLNETNKRLRGIIKNHEDRILELEKEVEYHKAFAGSAKIKKLELDIKYLEDKNRFLGDLNDEYRKMIVNDEDA